VARVHEVIEEALPDLVCLHVLLSFVFRLIILGTLIRGRSPASQRGPFSTALQYRPGSIAPQGRGPDPYRGPDRRRFTRR
jgi:hypothetical protein